MSLRYWKNWIASAAVVGLGVLGTTSAHAADYVTSCSPSGIQWTPVQQVTLGPETTLTGIWGTWVTLTVDCTDNGETLPLEGASFMVSGYSYSIPDLQVTIDGTDPTLATQYLPVAQFAPGGTLPLNPPLVLAYGLTSDTNGQIKFDMQAYSQSQPVLSPTGAATPIGLQMDLGYATPSTGGSLPVWLMGGGQIFAATPELDSLALFGSGAVALAGYGLMRLRARRRD